MDRCTQLGYTFVETIVSGVYTLSLTKLLKLKSSVRRRRVMMDLIYVNIIAVSLDVLTVVLVFLNQLGISHPAQNVQLYTQAEVRVYCTQSADGSRSTRLKKGNLCREKISS